ncbi:MAG: efflux RND transporter permease subunit [Candidatus Aminicenantes bacterium]|nr:efflux RND transporter permease subunit [Candidatus Aminicenantes bacterium]
MNFSEVFIRRPVMTALLMSAILIFGILGYRLLPVSDLPNVDFPTIQVTAGLPGASPETMAVTVATPLEKQFSTIQGLDSMTSTNQLGMTQITLQFALSRNLDAAAQDVQEAIAFAARQLPQNMPSPPVYQKVNPANTPILFMMLTSEALPLSTLDDYAQTTMAQRISMVSGVAQVAVYGSQTYAVRVQLDPDALASRGIGIDQVSRAVQAGNVNLPTGTLYGPNRAFTVQSTGQLNNAAAYRELIVMYKNGSPVRLKDLGRVIDSVQNDKVAAWAYRNNTHQRTILLAIQRQPGTNTVAVAGAVKKLLPIFRSQLPASIDFQILFDRSESIQSSVNDVKFTLVLALVLVVFVIFFFLRNVRATVIPSLALPFSIVGTFAVMQVLGFSLDNLSLMALTLSIGFLVDDAIIMLENVVRHQEMGESAFEATLKGSKEIGFTIVSMTLSLAAVFIPILFMGGILGRLFHEFAITIAAAVLISGFVSLTLTPAMCSRVLRAPGHEKHGALYRLAERTIQAMLNFYRVTLAWVIKRRRATLAFSGVVLVLTVVLFMKIPKGFIPSEDSGLLMGVTEAAQGISFQSMIDHQLAAAKVVQEDPNVESFVSAIGGIGASNSGRMFIRLKPRGQRPLKADAVVASLRSKLFGLTGINTFILNPPPITVGGRFTKSLYQFTLQCPEVDTLYSSAAQLESRMRAMPILQDVTTDMQLQNPEVTVEINRDKALAKGITPFQIEDALYYSYGSRQVSTIYAATNQYFVIMELEPQYQMDPSQLSKLYILSSSGGLVPLESVARLVPTVGPLTVNHSGQIPSVTVSFNLRPGVSLGPAVDQITRLGREILPTSVSTNFQGSAQAFQSSMSGLGFLLLMTIVVIYMILGILYESFVHPLTILSALPFAGFGALVTLFLFRTELSIYAFVGVIMLVGLVKKNGIMMVDFALAAERGEGKNAEDAIFEACLIRFRPIMMTTLAALFGTLPIAIGFGAGAESRRPLGLAVVGGLLFSQLVTLYVTPVIYVTFDNLRKRWGKAKGGQTPAETPAIKPARG